MSNVPRLGSGQRFKQLANKFAHEGIDNPGALAAKVGRRKYGKSKMAKLALTGKKRHERERHENE